jgi:hypothetical protein
MKCFPEVPYAPPPGYVDYPYYQTYDVTAAAALANGDSPRNLSIPADGFSEFRLRALMGMPDILQPTGSLQIYGASRHPFAHSEMKLAGAGIYPMLPEHSYSKGIDISFDLSLISKTGQPYGKLIFQGVKRFAGDYTNPRPSLYDYTEQPYSWLPVTNVPGQGNAPFLLIPGGVGTILKYNLPIENYDFELLEIRAANVTTGLPCSGVFAMRVWDPDFPPRLLMDSPILDRYLINNADGATQADLIANVTTRVPATFPVPSMLYPLKSLLQIEITSMVAQATLVQIEFRGIQRIPKRSNV